MEETPGSNSESWRQNLMLAKILLRNYGILHEFHVSQLENYPVACCSISLDGAIEVDADTKTVTYRINTTATHKKVGNESVPRHKSSPYRFMLKTKKYADQLSLARINLNTWTKELLWPETQVKVFIDGREIK